MTQVKIGNNVDAETVKAGYFYVTNNLSKAPLSKQEFGFSDKNGKHTFDVNGLKGKYFVLVLYPKSG